MAEKKGYRGLSNPARICAQLQKSIAKSPSNGVTIDEVRQLIRNEDEGVWSEQDVIGFFTNSPQKVFVLRGDQLFLRNVDESSSEDEAPRRVKSKARDVVRKEEVPESCRNCEKLVASTDEILREAEVLDKRVAERMDFLKEKQNIVQRLRNDRDRAENDIASSSMRDSDAALNGRDSSLARKTECTETAFSVSQRKLEIFRQMNSSRRLLTQRQIQEHVVFPPSQRHHRKITLVSSDDESSSDGEKFTSGKYEMVPSEQRCYSSDEDIARSRDPVPIPVVEQKENAIIETGIKDLMRTQWERRDPGGLFNFYEGLTRETRDRHDLGTIVNVAGYPLADGKLSAKIHEVVHRAQMCKQLRKGLKSSTKDVQRGLSHIVIISADTDPIDLVLHVPQMCDDNRVPYIFVASNVALGSACGLSRVVAVSVTKAVDEDAELRADVDELRRELRALRVRRPN